MEVENLPFYVRKLLFRSGPHPYCAEAERRAEEHVAKLRESSHLVR